MKPSQILCWIIPAVILFACNNNKHNAMESVDVAALDETKKIKIPSGVLEEEQQKIPTGNKGEPQTDSVAAPSPAKAPPHIDWDKKIIKSATVKLEVKDYKKYNDIIHQTIKQFGGYVAQEEQNTSDYKLETTITLKVPVDQFDNLMNGLATTDAKVMEKKVTSEDVTGEVVDVKSRLEAKKQMRLKYLDFLKQSKNMEEALQVQSEINGIQEAIEAAAGRVNYLTHAAAMSSVQITFYQPLEGFNPKVEDPLFLTRIVEAFKAGGKWCADVFVGLVAIWPLILSVLLISFFFKRKFSSKAKPANS